MGARAQGRDDGSVLTRPIPISPSIPAINPLVAYWLLPPGSGLLFLV
jgi:hypothetical protein